MLAKQIQVIRKNRTREGRPFQFPMGRTSAAVDAASGPAPVGPAGVTQARIVESNSDYVILEMVCGCGRKSFVQCNYGNVAGSQNVQETRP